jgi:hypothetical protein
VPVVSHATAVAGPRSQSRGAPGAMGLVSASTGREHVVAPVLTFMA